MLLEALQGMHGDVSQVLACELVNQLVNAPRDDAKVLRDLLNRRPAMNAGLDSEYAKWSGECYLVMSGFPANVPG